MFTLFHLLQQLAAILITRQVIGNLKEAFLPFLYWRAKLYKVGYDMVSELSPVTPDEQDKPVEGATQSAEGPTEETAQDKDSAVVDGKKSEGKVEQTLSFTQAEVESAMKRVITLKFIYSNSICVTPEDL